MLNIISYWRNASKTAMRYLLIPVKRAIIKTKKERKKMKKEKSGKKKRINKKANKC
jgi:hypothetical protein